MHATWAVVKTPLQGDYKGVTQGTERVLVIKEFGSWLVESSHPNFKESLGHGTGGYQTLKLQICVPPERLHRPKESSTADHARIAGLNTDVGFRVRSSPCFVAGRT